jgi:uncharacterized protein RhaS with RHS repeats
VRPVNGQAYSYDANGNLTSGGGRTYAWNGNPPSATSQTFTPWGAIPTTDDRRPTNAEC